VPFEQHANRLVVLAPRRPALMAPFGRVTEPRSGADAMTPRCAALG